MGPTTQDRSQTLQYVLILMTRNRALRIVRLAGGSRNGFEAWRKLTAWYEPPEAGRQVGLLSQILNPSYRSTTLIDWEEDYFKWRELVEKYDSVETQALQDNVKISIVLKHAPEQIRQQLQLQSGTFGNNFQRLDRLIQDFILNQRSWRFYF